jgi:rSAM/selenodomain-associated transferase 2
MEPDAGTPADRISVIIPTLNEATTIENTLDRMGHMPGLAEVLVVDGGSTDGTPALVRSRGARLLESVRGRGSQLHAGAVAAAGDILWFLHADTQPPQDAAAHIRKALSDPAVLGGYFTIRFDGNRRAAGILTWIYPHLGWLGLCYGDSGIFVRRTAYEQAGDFRPYPIFEDLDLLHRLRRRGRVARLPAAIVASSRRFEDRSFALTFAWWSVLQVLYWLGVPPYYLGRLYAPIRGRKQTPQSAPTNQKSALNLHSAEDECNLTSY